jgi:hypothetical protein
VTYHGNRHLPFALNGMSYTLHYRSSRNEVWRWYWTAWRTRFWRVHVLLAAAIALLSTYGAKQSFQPRLTLMWFVIVLLVITLFAAAWPQVMFKGQERTLNIGPDGWSTQIGHLTGARFWGEVMSIVERNGTLVIAGKNGNALIVPQRALPNFDSWQQFVRNVQAWHQARE